MRKWFPAAFIVAAVLFSVAVYSRLPEQVPTHWGISVEPDDFPHRQHVHAAKIEVGIGRGKAIQVRATDGHEQERVGLLCDCLFETGFGDHAVRSQVKGITAAERRALSRNALARS